MESGATVPSRTRGLPIRTLQLTVLEGPDAGKTLRSEAERVTVGTATGNDLVLTDSTVSRFHLELARQGDRVLVTDHGSTNGTSVGGALLERGSVPPGTVLALGSTRLKVDQGAPATVDLIAGERLGGLLGRSDSMRRLLARIEKVAKSESGVLVLGESGTGKELIAQAIHQLSPRAKRPFVVIDCGALTPTLIASELFGHEKGAFTGAEQRHVGAFERAAGGTLFLDEVGELPPPLQTALLGALERKSIRRVGGKEAVPADVRVVAATNRDLRAEVNRGAFRLDLYYRLAVVLLEVPPLRARPDDLPLLIEHFLREAGHAGPLEELLSPEALGQLSAHHWPGNVRELRNVVEALLAMGEVPEVGRTDSPRAEGADVVSGTLGLSYREAREKVLADFEGRWLKERLARAKGNVSLCAREARMDRSHLIELLKKHGLKARD